MCNIYRQSYTSDLKKKIVKSQQWTILQISCVGKTKNKNGIERNFPFRANCGQASDSNWWNWWNSWQETYRQRIWQGLCFILVHGLWVLNINIWRFAFKLNKIAHLKTIMNHPAWLNEITFYLYYNQWLFILFFQAYQVLGQFLVLNMQKKSFEDWLQNFAGATSKQSSECCEDLSDWCDQFL